MKQLTQIIFMAFLTLSALPWPFLNAAEADGNPSKKEKLAAEIYLLINQQRVQQQLIPLEQDATLQLLVDEWAERSARLNSMDHRKNLTTLQKVHGFTYLNENIYRSSDVTSANRVVAAWMKSRGHKKNLLTAKASLGAVAIGFTPKGGTIVVFQGGRK